MTSGRRQQRAVLLRVGMAKKLSQLSLRSDLGEPVCALGRTAVHLLPVADGRLYGVYTPSLIGLARKGLS
jgi:hypothetical protein